MKSFKQFFNENNEDNYYYHATYKPYLKSIKKEGLNGHNKIKNWDDSKHGIVYLANHPDVARSHAETSDSVPDHYIDHIHIIKIHKKHLDPNKIKSDSNIQGNDGSSIEYHGSIPPQHLKISK